ncbi:MAG: TIGR03619 family F420-dependent LLM class oxidoreductase, partial [Actinobacteria bacterium]|nr:TIGR03619 family F420-dependent LLM class oxidoreductase [Actinomycetota bacterium]
QHLFYPLNPASGYSARPGLAVPEAYRSILQPMELLAAVAAWTSSITIGTSILVAGYHRPVDLAQRISTLDILSGGRTVFGFSVGWSDEEHAQYDVDPRTRGRRADELIDALLACWGSDPVSYEGEFFSIPESDVRPKPLQLPHPPLMSGMRSAAGLRRTAEKFDVWNPASGTLDQHLATFAEISAMRPAHLAPLAMCWNLFTHPPVEVANLRPLSVDELCSEVAAAAAAGVEAVSVDANFDPSIICEADWLTVPDRLAPLLDAARG